jgi:hypothetical protein
VTNIKILHMYSAFFIAKLNGFVSMHVMSTEIQKFKFDMLSYEKCRSSITGFDLYCIFLFRNKDLVSLDSSNVFKIEVILSKSQILQLSIMYHNCIIRLATYTSS